MFSISPSALQIFNLFNIMFVVLFGNQGWGDQVSEEGGRNEVEPPRLKNQQAYCAGQWCGPRGNPPIGKD